MQLSSVIKFASAAAFVVSIYTISPVHAQDNDWGCQVLLCLTNPGGAAEFAERRPPIVRLWNQLSLGRAFPSCSGVDFTVVGPYHEPYSCDEDFSLISRKGHFHRDPVSCVSSSRLEVEARHCDETGDEPINATSSGVNWERISERIVCTAFISGPPNIRSKPNFVDVTIQGAGQRFWF